MEPLSTQKKMRSGIYFLALLSGLCDGAYKKWMQDTNFGNPQNWNAGRAPCGNDVAIIPERSPIVFMQMNTTIRELVLPRDGRLLLGSDMTIPFSDSRDQTADCPGASKRVTFNNLKAPAWMDPGNWCQVTEDNSDCQQVPLLDSEKIPGMYDDVAFPRENSFFADLGTGIDIVINALKIWSSSLTSETFRDFRTTREGQQMFPTPRNAQQRVVTMHNQQCTDVTGCATGNDVKEVMKEICRFEKSRCSRPRCESPVQPSGHCCQLCGAVITLTYQNGFRLKKLVEGIKTNILEQNDSYSEIAFIASKLSDGNTIQLVLTDESGQASGDAASMIETNINSDIENDGIIYKVSSLALRTSGIPTSPVAGKHGGSDTVPGGEIAAIIVGLIAILGLVSLIAILVYRKRIRGVDDFKFQLFKQFSLPRRHHRSQADASRHGPFSIHVPETLGPSDQAFENPMFGNTTFENDKYFELSPTGGSEQIQPESNESGSFANPLYDLQMEESIFDDPTKVSSTEKMKTGATEETTDA